jgi:hypothetical protein
MAVMMASGEKGGGLEGDWEKSNINWGSGLRR